MLSIHFFNNKKKLILLIFLFICIKPKTLQNFGDCDLVVSLQKLKKGQLSDYWAQEMVGSDLLREELESLPRLQKKNWITIFDTSKKGHYMRVKNLISDALFQAVLPELVKSSISMFNTVDGRTYKKAIKSVEGSSPSFVNNSMVWGDKTNLNIIYVYKAIQTLPYSSVIVSAAGNNYPDPLLHFKSKASKNLDIIIVGNFSSKGFVSSKSQEGKEVHILAPADKYISTLDVDGNYKKFSGTSGATALVTASLAGFEWLSGYHPTREESKILLEKTAIKTVHSYEKPRMNGVGLLNSYKLGMVGKRLKRKCEDQGIRCFKQEIRNEESYRFEVDKTLMGDLKETFPGCYLKKKISRGVVKTCNVHGRRVRTVFKRLRQSVLLNPERKELWEVLSCIYKGNGFSVNAGALDMIAMSAGSRQEVIEVLEALIEIERMSYDSKIYISGTLKCFKSINGGMDGIMLLKNIYGGVEETFTGDEGSIIRYLVNVLRTYYFRSLNMCTG